MNDHVRTIRELRHQHRRDQHEIAQLRLRLRDAEENASYRAGGLRKRPLPAPDVGRQKVQHGPPSREEECEELLRVLGQVLQEGARDFGCIIPLASLPHMRLRALYDGMAHIIRESVDAMREDMRILYQWGHTNLRQNLFSNIFEGRLNERLQDPDAYIAGDVAPDADVTRVARLLTLHREISPGPDSELARVLRRDYPNCFPHSEVRRRTMGVLTLANEFITHLHTHIRMYQTQTTFSGAVLRSRPLSLYQQWEETFAPATVRDNAILKAAIDRAPVSGSSPTRTKMLIVEDVAHIRRVVTSETVVESEGANWRPCEDARIVMILEDVLRAMPPRRLHSEGRLETPREFIMRIATRLRPHTVDGMPDIGSVVIRDEDEASATVLPVVQPRSEHTVPRDRVDAVPAAPTRPPAPAAHPDVDYSQWISTSSPTPNAQPPSELLNEAIDMEENDPVHATLVMPSGETRPVRLIRVPGDIARRMGLQDDVGPYRVGGLTFAPMRRGEAIQRSGSPS